MAKISQADRNEAKAELRKLLKPSAQVCCIMRHVSSSGMSRVIDLAIPVRVFDNVYPLKPEDQAAYPGERDYSATPKRVSMGLSIRSIGWLAAKAAGYSWDTDRQGIRMGGCGMDMGFQAVYSLGAALWPNGTKRAHGMRNGEPDHAGGYALKHRWL